MSKMNLYCTWPIIRGNRIGEMCFSSQGTQFVKLAGTPWSRYHRCGSSGCFHQTTRLGAPFNLGGWEIQHQGVDELGVSLHAVSSSHGVRGKAAFWGLLRRQWPHTQGTLPSWPTRPQSLAFELRDDRNNQPVPLSSGSSRYCYKTPESRQLIDKQESILSRFWRPKAPDPDSIRLDVWEIPHRMDMCVREFQKGQTALHKSFHKDTDSTRDLVHHSDHSPQHETDRAGSGGTWTYRVK